MKKLIMDLDNTITKHVSGMDYKDMPVNIEVVEQMKAYKEMGYSIVISTARNMRTYEGNVGKINAITLPVIMDWLKANDVPYDEVWVGKPWCGYDGFYVDDKAVRPSEFVNLSIEEIQRLIK